MSLKRLKALQSLATLQGVKIETVKEFAIFARTAKL